MTASPAVPTAITDHRASGVLEITWKDGRVSRLGHPLLRESCRCAACEQLRRRGRGVARADDALRLVHIEPVGEQGLNLGFSDGHDRGIYPWSYLRQLGTP
jgi:DUF971 family protein